MRPNPGPTCHNCRATMAPSVFTTSQEWCCPDCSFMARSGVGPQYDYRTLAACACAVCLGHRPAVAHSPSLSNLQLVCLVFRALARASVNRRH